MIRDSREDRIFNILNLTILTVFLLLVLYPLIYVVSASFSSASALVSGQVVLLPVRPTLAGYEAVFRNESVWTGYLNTVFYTASFMLLSTTLTVLAAYPLSRKDFAARHVITLLFSFTMWFGGGLIPHYLLIRNLGLLNTPLAVIVPGAMGVYNAIIMRTFFQSNIPDSLLESAKIDGCSDFRFLVRIVLPLSPAILAVILLYTGVGMWNSYMSAFLYLSDRRKYPLQLILREILLMNQVSNMESEASMNAVIVDEKQINELRYLSELLKYSLIVVSAAPLMVAYPFLQKYFMKGVMVGAIKG